MSDLNVKMELPSTSRLPLVLLLIAFLFAFCGCMSKSTVTYFPQQKNSAKKSPADQNQEVTEALRQYFASWQGTRYSLGGLSRKGVDCSGLTLLTYKELFGKDLPRTVREQAEEGTKISKAALQPGDLVFFKTGAFQRHVGVYLEEDLFFHASFSKGVMISSLNNAYWQKKFWQAQRLRSGADSGQSSPAVNQQTVAVDY
ncbi:NlpC/P60 family protein [Desulfocastanea catecholica]